MTDTQGKISKTLSEEEEKAISKKVVVRKGRDLEALIIQEGGKMVWTEMH